MLRRTTGTIEADTINTGITSDTPPHHKQPTLENGKSRSITCLHVWNLFLRRPLGTIKAGPINMLISSRTAPYHKQPTLNEPTLENGKSRSITCLCVRNTLLRRPG